MSRSTIIFLIFLLITGITIHAQDTEPDPDQLDFSGIQKKQTEESVALDENRLKTGIEVGTSFMYSPKNFYGPSYYVAPRLSYRVTPRFLLSAGIGLEYSGLYPLYSTPEPENNMLPMTRLFLYTQGSYLLNERLILSGAVYKSMIDVPRLSQNMQPYNYDYQGVDIGIQYQINRNFSVGFHMRMSNTNYPSSGLIPLDALVPVPGF